MVPTRLFRLPRLFVPLLVIALLGAFAVPATASAQDDSYSDGGATSDRDIGSVTSLRLISFGGGTISPGTGGFADLATLGFAWTWGMDIKGLSRRRTARGTPFTFGIDLFNVGLGENSVFHWDVFFDKAVIFDTGSDSAWFTLSFGGRTGLAASIVTDDQGFESTVWYLPLLATANFRLMFADVSMYIEIPVGPAFKLGAPSRINNDDTYAPGTVFVIYAKFGVSLDF